MGCLVENKVNLATYKLKDEVEQWWRATREIKFEGQELIHWNEFLEEFNKKFFPRHVKNSRSEEFLHLQ